MKNYIKEYKNLVANIKNAYLYAQTDSTKAVLESILPELAESEDERIRKEIIEFANTLKSWVESGRISMALRKDDIDMCNRWIAYLEKQKDYAKNLSPEQEAYIVSKNFQQAEKEKDEFTTRQFLQCLMSFDEFKEGEHYWLEYIGGDTYVGRSDNILGKKIHITPRQLFALFSQQLDEAQAAGGRTGIPTISKVEGEI